MQSFNQLNYYKLKEARRIYRNRKDRERRRDYPERAKAAELKYRLNNKEKIKAAHKIWRDKNRDKIKARNLAYYHANKNK